MVSTQSQSDVIQAPEATYGFTDLDSPARDDLQVDRVTPHGWRVSDMRLPSHDPLRLLAFIERREQSFEVMQLGRGFEWHEFSTFDGALDFVLRTAARFAQARLLVEWDERC